MMEQPVTDEAQERADYIAAMLESFEHENPGIAEVLALHDDAMRHYIDATNAYRDTVVRSSSSHSIITGE